MLSDCVLRYAIKKKLSNLNKKTQWNRTNYCFFNRSLIHYCRKHIFLYKIIFLYLHR